MELARNRTKREAALHAAQAGYHVHPLYHCVFDTDGVCQGCSCHNVSKCPSPGKHPLLRGWPETATQDPGQVDAWWKRWPDANIGAVSGNGLLVLDVDGPEGVQSLRGRIVPTTRRVDTGREDGYHLHFAIPRDLCVPNAAKKVAGLDWRGNDGNVVLPGSVHYTGKVYRWAPGCSPDDMALAEAPEWLIELVVVKAPSPRQAVPAIGLPHKDGSQYAAKALSDEVTSVARAAQGCRNNTLNRAAFSLGQLVAVGELGKNVVRDTLIEASHSNGLFADDGEQAVLKTIESGLQAGMENPRAARPSERQGTPWTFEDAGTELQIGTDGVTRKNAEQPGDVGQTDGTRGIPEVEAGGLPANAGETTQSRTGTAAEPKDRQQPVIYACLATELLDRLKDVSWLWPGWLPVGYISVLAGEPGIGKSNVALSLAATQVTDTPWPDGAECALSSPVLISDSEGAQALWIQRIRQWHLPADRLFFAGDDGFGRIMLDDKQYLSIVADLVHQHGIKLVIVDSLRTAVGARVDENGSGIGAILAPWADLCRDLDCCLLLVHHFGKRRQGESNEASMDRLRGSSAIAAMPRSIIALDKPDPQSRLLRLSCVKSNLGELPRPLGFTIGDGGIAWTVNAPVPPKPATQKERAIEFLRERLSAGPQGAGELLDAAKRIGINKNPLYEAQKALGVQPDKDPSDPTGKRHIWSLAEGAGASQGGAR